MRSLWETKLREKLKPDKEPGLSCHLCQRLLDYLFASEAGAKPASAVGKKRVGN